MAPRKRKAAEQEEKPEEAEPAKVVIPARVTRSATRRAADANSVVPEEQGEKTKMKKKAKGAKKKGNKSENVEEAEEGGGSGNGEDVEESSDNADDGTKKRTIVIEHCKQCRSFKERAVRVKEGLEKGVSGIIVLLNPDKPRRGCFEIREEGGEKFISLLEMKRPFRPMKDLDMAEVIEDIIDKIK